MLQGLLSNVLVKTILGAVKAWLDRRAWQRLGVQEQLLQQREAEDAEVVAAQQAAAAARGDFDRPDDFAARMRNDPFNRKRQ